MARGFIKGMVSGAAVSLSAVAVLSVVSDVPDAVTHGAAQGAAEAPAATRTPDAADASAATNRLTAPDLEGPTPDTLTGLLPETLSPAAVPQTGPIGDMQAAQAPEAQSSTGIQPPAVQAPRAVSGQGSAPEAPAADPGVSVSTAPAQANGALPQQSRAAGVRDQAPDVTTDIGALVMPVLVGPQGGISSDPAQPPIPDIPATSGAFGSDAAGARDAEDTDLIAALPQSSADTNASVRAENPPEVAPAPTQPSQTPEVSDAVDLVGPQSDSTLDTAATAALEKPAPQRAATLSDDSADAQVDADPSVQTPARVAAPQGTAAVPAVIDPVPAPAEVSPLAGITAADTAAMVPEKGAPQAQRQRGQDVRVNQLPSLGNTSRTGTDSPSPQVSAPARVLTPFEKYTADFENADAKPLMAIVLMDTGADLGSESAGLAALKQLPFPVSFAVDALREDAGARMEAFRDAGFEVLAAVDLPAGATASDAEVNLSVALQAMPEALGVLEGAETGVQTTADAGRQVARILAQTGHGFVTQNRGLNTVQKLAAREGVPSGVVFRDFDGEGQSASAMRRYLDQAAFRAAQEGDVILLGRMRAETLAVLMLWALQDRASSIEMAPVSAVLRTN